MEIYAIFDNGYMALYIDGELIVDEEFYQDATINEAETPLTIGYTIGTNNNNDPLNTHFNGCIDDLRIYDIVIHPGLVAYYPFNSNANDESGNGNDGIVNGATITTDRFGNENSAYSFDGVDDFIDCGYNSSQIFSDQLTMIAWVNTNSQSNVQFIFSKWGGANTNESFYLALDGNNIPYGKINFTDTQEIVPQSNNSIDIGNWYMLAMTYNQDSALYYVNGVMVDTIYDDREILSGTLPLIIGDDNGNNLRFSGKIDDCRLYNVALSPSEIENIYNPTTNVNSLKSDYSSLNLFPNPNNGVFHIKMQNNVENTILIYSMDGKLVFNNKFKDSCELNLMNLEKGIYLVKVVSNDYIETKKLIIE
ncbi:MAG: T9SS type A sorting domain-containing protein [Bacteroidales bacterium]|nr:T9SS type A sorting domain-containing protein [Bacteroidales bacterium]